MLSNACFCKTCALTGGSRNGIRAFLIATVSKERERLWRSSVENVPEFWRFSRSSGVTPVNPDLAYRKVFLIA